MAVKEFNCNLNGGDAVTPDNDLTFRIYGSSDSYITPIATKGSHNSDSDVTVTGDVVVLTNVNVGSETSFKISSVDENGNEAPLSDAFNLHLFEDTFDGTTIDTVKWTVTETGDGTLTQNEKAIWASTGSTISGETRLTQKTGIEATTYAFDLKIASQNTGGWTCACVDDSNTQQGFIINRSTTAGKIGVLIKYGGSNVVNTTATVDVSGWVSFKCVDNGSNLISLWYWNGSAWTSLATNTNTFSLGLHFYLDRSGDSSQEMEIDNIYFTDTDYSTQYP